MATFTKAEIDKLYEPFPLAAHKIREGGSSKSGNRTQWFVYLDRVAVQRRLDEFFPGEWEFIPLETYRSTDGKYINITASMTIRGIARAFNGGRSVIRADDYPDEDLEKGAMTDTFRRVASLWGLGAYLYDSIPLWTDGYTKGNYQERQTRENEAKQKFVDWYNGFFGQSVAEPEKPDERTNGQVSTSKESPTQPKADKPKKPDKTNGNPLPEWWSKVIAEIKDWPQMESPTASGRTAHAANLLTKLREAKTIADEMPYEAIIDAIKAYYDGDSKKPIEPPTEALEHHSENPFTRTMNQAQAEPDADPKVERSQP